MRARGVPVRPGQLSHQSASLGVRAQSSRCPGRSRRATRVTLQTVKCHFQPGFSGCCCHHRPLTPRPQQLQFAALGGADLCFPHLPPLGFQPLGALFSFLTFKSMGVGGATAYPHPRNRNECLNGLGKPGRGRHICKRGFPRGS